MSFFSKARSGPKVGGDCKKGGGIAGSQGDAVSVSFKIPGAGPQEGYEQNVVKRSGSSL